jgi:RNase P/RNase MRP subunit POP5
MARPLPLNVPDPAYDQPVSSSSSSSSSYSSSSSFPPSRHYLLFLFSPSLSDSSVFSVSSLFDSVCESVRTLFGTLGLGLMPVELLSFQRTSSHYRAILMCPSTACSAIRSAVALSDLPSKFGLEVVKQSPSLMEIIQFTQIHCNKTD